MSTTPTATIVGAGSIGVAFAVQFARSGFHVRMWDALPEALPRAARDRADRVRLLHEHGLIDEPVEVVLARISDHEILYDALRDADLVQECAPEQLPIKRDLFRMIGSYSPAHAVLASSSSAIPASAFADVTPARDRVLIGHPGNPPYLIPVIELVGGRATSEATMQTADQLYRRAGLRPVRVRSEIEGFIFNRLQGAVLREAYCLVRDGVASADDVDEVMRSGLGRRWAFIGPFETVDLNTRGGIASHALKMGPAYERMGAERGQHDPWTEELVATVAAQRRDLLPLEQWEDRVRWRDEMLMEISRVLAAESGSPSRPVDAHRTAS